MAQPESPELPKPSWTLVVCSWVVIAGCIGWGSLNVAMAIAHAWDPMMRFGGVIFCLGSLVLAAMQYTGTFRRHRGAAHGSAAVLFGLGLLLWTPLAGSVASMAVKASTRQPWEIFAVFSAVGTCALCASWLNYQWRAQLRTLPARDPFVPRLSLLELLGFVTALAISLGIVTYFVRTAMPRFAEHLETSSPPLGIPAGARDICFGQGARGTISYEFAIDEPGFREWVAARTHRDARLQSRDPEEIGGEFRVYNYRNMLPGAKEVDQTVVDDGLVFSWAEADAGFYYVFDRRTSRAYYHSHSH